MPQVQEFWVRELEVSVERKHFSLKSFLIQERMQEKIQIHCQPRQGYKAQQHSQNFRLSTDSLGTVQPHESTISNLKYFLLGVTAGKIITQSMLG